MEYADVLEIPFDFTAKPVVAPPQSPRKTIQVRAVRPDRDSLEVRFPRVAGYRVELPEERLTAQFNEDSVLELTPDLVGPLVTRNEGIIGEGVDLNLVHTGDLRRSTLLFHITQRLLYTKRRDPGEEPKLGRIPGLKARMNAEESFFVRHAYFLGANDPYKSLKTTVKAEINEETWATLNSDISCPFDKPKSGRIAVKVINHLGDEVMKVF